MSQPGRLGRKPLAAAVVAVVLAFAVVCPVMAAPGVPVEQGCHTNPEPTHGDDRTAACCSSVTVPKQLQSEPGVPAPLPSIAAAVRTWAWGSRFDGPLPDREARPPLFVQHAALLI